MSIKSIRRERVGSVSARRISVVGDSGSGKTCLARQLASRLALPVLELDALRLDESGRQLPGETFAERVKSVVEEEEWIVDGHYRAIRHLVWRRAEMVVWLNYPPPLVAWRLAVRAGRRIWQRSNRSQSALEPGEREPAGVERASLARRAKRLARNARERREYRVVLHDPEYGGLIVVELRTPGAAASWLASLERQILK